MKPHFLIVKGAAHMLWAMAWNVKHRGTDIPADLRVTTRVHNSGAAMREMAQLAREALREEDGLDFGPLSHEERNKILFGN